MCFAAVGFTCCVVCCHSEIFVSVFNTLSKSVLQRTWLYLLYSALESAYAWLDHVITYTHTHTHIYIYIYIAMWDYDDCLSVTCFNADYWYDTCNNNSNNNTSEAECWLSINTAFIAPSTSVNADVHGALLLLLLSL